MAAPEITLGDLTQAQVNGTGAFDTLMRAMTGHLEMEFQKNRIKGPDYANVYLNALTPVLQNAVVFLLQKDEAAGKAALVDAQVRLTEAQILLAQKQLEQEEFRKELVKAQAELASKQALQVVAETLNVPKQGLLIDAQTDNMVKQGLLTDAQATKVSAESTNLAQELINLKSQNCLLEAQYDLTMVQKLQTTAQTSLVQQKVATEKAQTVGTGVEPDSVIGKQKALYTAQADGFKRDAEQKAAKIMVDTWNVRRTTDAGTVADATNRLSDANVGRAIDTLLTGVNA